MIQDDPRQEEAVEAHQAPEAGRRAEFNRYFAVRAHMGNLAFSPDGHQIAYLVNTSGQFNIWRQAITGGWAAQVTTFERETVRGLIWSPSGDVIATADSDGSSNTSFPSRQPGALYAPSPTGRMPSSSCHPTASRRMGASSPSPATTAPQPTPTCSCAT